MVENIENIRAAEIADGWLIMDLHSNTQEYVITIEYHDGESIETNRYKDYTRAYKKFNSLGEKLDLINKRGEA
ncbi:MAG: hypothetical protein PHE67_11755 [Campylobacterales bacterium]|nr:hypothetical protein [Campylobacterales bacterium]